MNPPAHWRPALKKRAFDEMSQSDLLLIPLDRTQAKKLLARFLALYAQGKATLQPTTHFKQRCVERDVSFFDAVNVMKAGSINKQGEPDIKTGYIVYNIETAKMEVSFQFVNESFVRLITIKRRR